MIAVTGLKNIRHWNLSEFYILPSLNDRNVYFLFRFRKEIKITVEYKDDKTYNVYASEPLKSFEIEELKKELQKDVFIKIKL